MQGSPLVLSGITSGSLAYAALGTVHFQAQQSATQIHQRGVSEVINVGKFSLSSLSISIYRRRTAEGENNCCEETEHLKQLRGIFHRSFRVLFPLAQE